MFANGAGDPGSIPCRVIPKTQKWYLIPPCLILSIIRYVSRANRAIKGKEMHPPLEAIEKGALGSASTTVVNFTYICEYYIH